MYVFNYSFDSITYYITIFHFEYSDSLIEIKNICFSSQNWCSHEIVVDFFRFPPISTKITLTLSVYTFSMRWMNCIHNVPWQHQLDWKSHRNGLKWIVFVSVEYMHRSSNRIAFFMATEISIRILLRSLYFSNAIAIWKFPIELNK